MPPTAGNVSTTVARGLVRCSVVSEGPLPASAYPIVGELAAEIAKYEERLRVVLVRDRERLGETEEVER